MMMMMSLISLGLSPRAAGVLARAARAAHTRAAAAAAVPALRRSAPGSGGGGGGAGVGGDGPPRPRVVVGMSGGVDSSVAAYLLRARGFDVVGLHMVNWDEADEAGHRGRRPCAVAEQEYTDVRAVCARLGVPAHQCNFVQDYWHDVFAPMLDGYDAGVTPNPDVLCNRHIKFDVFLRHAVDVLGADYVATGHYARTDAAGRVLAGVDRDKDQSYFLCGVEAAALRGDGGGGGGGGGGRVLFPCGALRKEQVRRIARVAGLEEVAEKQDSYGICFVGKRNFAAFIAEYVPLRPGRFVSVEDGSTVGPPEGHQGFATYTVGQGARISGAARKWYVVDKRVVPADIDAGADGGIAGTAAAAVSHDVVVAQGRDHPALFADVATVRADAFNWVAGAPPEALLPAGASMRVQSRVRYRQGLEWCTVSLEWCESTEGGEGRGSGSGGRGDDVRLRLVARFDAPQFAVAPGQILALYDGDVCLGGGAVDERFRNRAPAEAEGEDAEGRRWWIPVWPDAKAVGVAGSAGRRVGRIAAAPRWPSGECATHPVALGNPASRRQQRRMYHASAERAAKGTPGERPRKKLSKHAYAKKKRKGRLSYRERMEMELGESHDDAGDPLMFDPGGLDSFDTVQSGILVMDDGVDDTEDDDDGDDEFDETDSGYDDRGAKLRSRKDQRKDQREARRRARREGKAVHHTSTAASAAPRSTATDQAVFSTGDPHDLRALLDMVEPSGRGDPSSTTSFRGRGGRRRRSAFPLDGFSGGTAVDGGADPVAEAMRVERRLRAPAPLPVDDRARERSRKNLVAAARLRDDIAMMLESGRVQLNPVVHGGREHKKSKQNKRKRRGGAVGAPETVVIESSEVDVVDVELSPDMRNATVWWTAPTRATLSGEERAAVTAALGKCSYKLRMTIAKARRLRVAPRLEWRDDYERLEKVREVDGLLDEVKARLDLHGEDDSPSLDGVLEEKDEEKDAHDTADGKQTTPREKRLVLEDL